MKDIYGDNLSKDALQKFLAKKEGVEKFPDDSDVKENFVNKTIYGKSITNTKIPKLILLEIEKLSNKEPPKEDLLTIEHFYPQTSTPQWRELDENYEQLENEWINTFGNLTLSGLNSRLGNNSFDKKRELISENGSLHLNKYFLNIDTWNIEEIKKRGETLAEKFIEVEIFKDIPKDYRKKDSIYYSLNEDITGKQVYKITLPNEETKVINNLKELAKVIIEYIKKNHEEEIERLLRQQPSFIKDEYTEKPGTISIKFGNFVFFSGASSRDVTQNLKKFVEGCNLDIYKFKIYAKNK